MVKDKNTQELYWGGAIYSERTAEYQLLKEFIWRYFGYSSVKFKTPKEYTTVKAGYDDIKLGGSFTSYNKNSSAKRYLLSICYHKDHPNDTTYANWCSDQVAITKIQFTIIQLTQTKQAKDQI